jgi:hypothetical protein
VSGPQQRLTQPDLPQVVVTMLYHALMDRGP